MQVNVRFLAAIFAAMALPLATANAAPAKWEPASPPELRALRGTHVALLFDVDLDGDQQVSANETAYLIALLNANEVMVRHNGDPQFVVDGTTLIVGKPIKPVATEEERSDPIKAAEHDRDMQRFNEADRIVEAFRARATDRKLRVIESADLLRALGLKPVTPDAYAAYERHRLAKKLSADLKEIKLDRVPLEIVLGYFADLTGLPISAEEQALAATGVKLDTPINALLHDVPAVMALHLVADEVDGVFITDGKSVRLTARAAKQPDGFEPMDDLVRREQPMAANELTTVHNKAMTARLDRELPELAFLDVPLVEAVDILRDITGVPIHIDRRALAAAGVKLDAPVNGNAKGLPFRHALGLLRSTSPHVAVYIYEGRLLRVTTRERAEAAVKASKNSSIVAPPAGKP
jgi:hypothetical protein